MKAFRSLLVLALVASLAAVGSADKFRFVVAGDGRGDNDGINEKIQREICDAVLREKAKFFLWTGDLVGGAKDDEQFKKMLWRWQEIMAPLYKAGIPVLPTRGNHELIAEHADMDWDEVFNGRFALPQNGPDNAKNKSYFFEFGPVLTLSMDQYTTWEDGKRKVNFVDVPWIQKTLREHPKPFVFSVCHAAGFVAGAHEDTMDDHLSMRDTLLQTLLGAGSRVMFCGHDHFYDHMVVRNHGVGPEFHQLVAGTAGAPFYPDSGYKGANEDWEPRRIKHLSNTYGYLLVEIDGMKCTITFKGRNAKGKYVPMDKFSYVAK